MSSLNFRTDEKHKESIAMLEDALVLIDHLRKGVAVTLKNHGFESNT